MSYYDTRNPMPSIDPRDLDDNAKHIDEFANSEAATAPDRFGVERKTLNGLRADGALLRADLAAEGGANLVGVDAADNLPATVQDVVGDVIFRDFELTVPGTFIGTAEAMDWLRTKTLANGARVTIRLLSNWTPSKSTDLNHPQGGNISILGPALPVHCLAVTPLSFDGFTCSDGHHFGLIDNLVVDATSKSEAPLNYSGIVATRGAFIGLGPGVSVNNYYYHFVARDGGVMFADFTKSTNSGDVAYWAFNGGHLRCRNAEGSNAQDVSQTLGFVFQAEYGGTLDCSGAKASGGLVAGIAALSGGTVRAYGSEVTGNTGAGYLARDGGVIVAHDGKTTGNTGYGIAQITSGRVLGNNMTISGNTAGGVRPAVLLDNNALGARLQATGGGLRIDTGTGGYNTDFHSSGGRILSLLHTENAVNNAYIAASAIGSPVRFGATGADINIDIYFQTKGTGVVRFGTFVTSADVPVVGSMTVRDAGGTLRKLAVIG